MKIITGQWRDQASRRRLIVILAGTLIVVALVAGRLASTDVVRNAL